MKRTHGLVFYTLCLLFVCSGCVTQTTQAVVSTLSASYFTTPTATPSPTATPTPTTTPSPTTAPTPTLSPTPEPTQPPIVEPHYVKWISPNDKEIFTDQDLKNIPIPLDMPREKMIDLFGLPPQWEVIFQDANGEICSIDTYLNGNIFYNLYDYDQKKYFLSDAVIRSKDIVGPRGIQVGDRVEKVLDAFYVKEGVATEYWGDDLLTILYDVIVENQGRLYAPCGYIYESDSYFLGWEKYPMEDTYQIHFNYCSADDPMYQSALAGDLDYFAVCLYSYAFTITDDKVSAMSWRYGASGE